MLGAGAIGGCCGGRSAQSSADVTFLIRGPHRELLHESGLRIESLFGDAVLHVVTATSDDVKPGGKEDAADL